MHGQWIILQRIIDVKSDQRLRDWLVRSSEKYPSTKQVDDYIE